MKTTRIPSLSRFLGLLILVATGPTLEAANITWAAPTTTTGELSDINTQGNVVFAWTANNVLAPLLSPLDPGGLNITFSNGPGLGQPVLGFDEFTWPDAGYDAMLQMGNWAGGDTTIQLPSLTPYRAYQIQFWVSDTRPCCADRLKTIGDGNGNNVTLNNGNAAGGSENVIGTWTADEATQTLAFIGANAAHPIYNAIIVRDISVDADNDGMPDSYEEAVGLDKLVNDAGGDPDADTLTNLQEYTRGTHANLADTDGDGIRDDRETNTGTYVSPTNTGTNPRRADTDGDLLNDAAETNTGIFASATNAGTNPFNPDTDADGFRDGLEAVYANSNPLNVGSRPLRLGLLDLLAYWSFDDATDPAQALDSVKGFGGVLQGTTIYTPDGGGRTGVGTDKAIDMGAVGDAGNGVLVAAGAFLDIGATQDQIAVSFWQQLSSIPASSSFWGEAPSVGGRGINAHAPYSNNLLYWDTAGCCDGTQRIQSDVNLPPGGPPPPWDFVTTPAWHHFVFQKKGSAKEIWLDGVLVSSGTNTAALPSDFTVLHIASDLGAANIAGLMDDFAVYGDALTPAEIALLASGTPPNSPTLVPPNTDSDADGMPNAYEIANGLNPNSDDRLLDLDSDGSNNFAEFLNNTLPSNPDTDGDGVKDGAETKTGIWVSGTNTGTDPLDTDSDGDGLSDGVETNSGNYVSAGNPGTNPTKSDTDGDSWSDDAEIRFGSNPTLAASVPSLNPAGLDILAWWPFDDASNPVIATDLIHSVDASLINGAVYSADAAGRTGAAGDMALDLGTVQGAQSARVLDSQWMQWLNLAARPVHSPNSGSLGAAADLVIGYTLDAPGALAGSADTALTFTGSSETRAPFSLALNPVAAFTAEAWLKPAVVNVPPNNLTCALASGHFADPRSGWLIYQSDLGWNFRTYLGSGTGTAVNITGGGPPVAGTWYHVVATWDGSVGRIYVNGVLGETSPVVPSWAAAADGDVHIGARSDGGFFWIGDADEVAFYNTALSDATVAAHYANGTNAVPPQPYEQLIAASNPTGYWRMTNPTPGTSTQRDELAVSFWQNLVTVTASSAFWITSPGSSERGFQAHTTWSDNNIYFDTEGCCDGTQRINGTIVDRDGNPPVDPSTFLTASWHHFVLQKKGPEKQVWVDGALQPWSASNNASIPSDLTKLYIGSAVESGSTVGLIDDFAIFGDALTEEQIGRLAAGESPTALLGPSAQLAFTNVVFNQATHTIQLTWNSQANAAYTLEGSLTMATGSWVEINDNIPSGGASTQYSYDVNSFPPGGATPLKLFLRVKKN